MDESTSLLNKLKPVLIYLTIFLAVLFVVLWSAKLADPGQETGRVVERMSSLRAVLYVDASSESMNQLKEFAPYAHLVNTVHCDEQEAICRDRQVETVPTIILESIGLELNGLQTKEELKNLFNQIGIW